MPRAHGGARNPQAGEVLDPVVKVVLVPRAACCRTSSIMGGVVVFILGNHQDLAGQVVVDFRGGGATIPVDLLPSTRFKII